MKFYFMNKSIIYIKVFIQTISKTPDGLPNSFLDAVRRYGTSSNKAPAISVVDHHGKIVYTLLYGMLYFLAANRKEQIFMYTQ